VQLSCGHEARERSTRDRDCGTSQRSLHREGVERDREGREGHGMAAGAASAGAARRTRERTRARAHARRMLGVPGQRPAGCAVRPPERAGTERGERSPTAQSCDTWNDEMHMRRAMLWHALDAVGLRLVFALRRAWASAHEQNRD